jgi:hypothetical protein
MGAYFDELVDGAHASQDHPIAHDHMSGHLGIVAEDTVIPDDTIVCDMAIGQDHAIFTHLGRPAIPGTPVDRYEFTDGGIIAYFYGSLFSVKFKVLRISRYDSSRIDPAILSDAGPFHDRYITSYPGPFSNLYILMNHREWIHFYTGSYSGVRMNRGERMDHSTIN